MAAYIDKAPVPPDDPTVLYIANTTLTAPEDPADWNAQAVPDVPSARVYGALALNGQLHVLHGGGLLLSTTSVEGLSAQSLVWETQPVTSEGSLFYIPDGWLVAIGGRLGIAYRVSGESRLRVAGPDPINAETAWREQALLALTNSCFSVFYSHAVAVGSRCAIVVRDNCNGGFRIMRQIAADPLPEPYALDAWDFFRVDTFNRDPSICETEGRIAVARYLTDESTRLLTLQFFLSNGPV